MKHELVEDWMTAEVITVAPDVPLPQAHDLMSRHWIRRLPVVLERELVGIITLGDVREAEPSDATSLSIWELNYLIPKLQVHRVMTPKPITISPKDTIGKATRLMLDHKISGLPVVGAQNQLVGIITESDIFRMLVQSWQENDESVEETINITSG